MVELSTDRGVLKDFAIVFHCDDFRKPVMDQFNITLATDYSELVLTAKKEYIVSGAGDEERGISVVPIIRFLGNGLVIYQSRIGYYAERCLFDLHRYCSCEFGVNYSKLWADFIDILKSIGVRINT